MLGRWNIARHKPSCTLTLHDFLTFSLEDCGVDNICEWVGGAQIWQEGSGVSTPQSK